jgi:hypothetical protein
MKKVIFAVTVTALCFSMNMVMGQGAKKVEPKCPVAGKAINKEAFVEHNGGKVYFCCMNCPKAFAKDTKKFEAKANQQLVVTGQAKQVKCPFTGGKLNPETKTAIGGVDACFCCMNCQGKAKDMEAAKAVEAVFGAAGFKKGFEVKKAGS